MSSKESEYKSLQTPQLAQVQNQLVGSIQQL